MVRLGLIGYPLGHSYSADYFKNKFADNNMNGNYTLYPIRHISEFAGLINSHPDLRGLNVTIPYKEGIISYLDEISAEARRIGAVNVISISKEDGDNLRLRGDNTDWIGFRESLLPLLKEDIRSALVLGTGGASKAVTFALESLGIEVTKVSRNPKLNEVDTIAYKSLDKEIINQNRLIVNTTPLGMYPSIDTYPEIPYEYLTPEHLCYDLVYNPEITRFMHLSRLKGAKVKNGLEMLHLQADKAWEIWMGK